MSWIKKATLAMAVAWALLARPEAAEAQSHKPAAVRASVTIVAAPLAQALADESVAPHMATAPSLERALPQGVRVVLSEDPLVVADVARTADGAPVRRLRKITFEYVAN